MATTAHTDEEGRVDGAADVRRGRRVGASAQPAVAIDRQELVLRVESGTWTFFERFFSFENAVFGEAGTAVLSKKIA